MHEPKIDAEQAWLPGNLQAIFQVAAILQLLTLL